MDAILDTELAKILATFLVAMLPVLELRGAIPLGISMGLDYPVCLFVAILGNIAPIPFIILFVRRVFQWMRSKSERLERFVNKREQKALLHKDVIYKYEVLGLLILVAIPLPGTGAWTGALLAALLDIRLKNAMLAIAGGVIGAGLIVTGVTYGFSALL